MFRLYSRVLPSGDQAAADSLPGVSVTRTGLAAPSLWPVGLRVREGTTPRILGVEALDWQGATTKT